MIDIHAPILMIDTETTNDVECPIVYDVGYQIFTLADGVFWKNPLFMLMYSAMRRVMVLLTLQIRLILIGKRCRNGSAFSASGLTLKRNLLKIASVLGSSLHVLIILHSTIEP